jgi:hypothetical protein|tara:strand:- start:127 stop:336 length:210 start_codon:yes stop_codon:yes gene_type:complete
MSNTLFADNARPKTVYVQMTRQTNGTYTVEKARTLDKANQYSRSIRRINKRQVTSELKQAAAAGKLQVL